MHLRYINKLGIPKDIELTGEPLSIGRSREADIPLLDDKVSRVHCGIRLSEGEFYLKDLKSRNGTFVNGERVEDTVKLKPGDRIQVGSTVFVLDPVSTKEGDAKAFGSMQAEMGDGKGYSTILKEIVEDIAPQIGVPKPSEAQAEAAEKPAGKPAPKGRPAIKISMNAKPEAPAQPDSDAPAASAAGGKKKIIIKR
ncbi:MAG TPA: FHA domain-containing protein [Kiritimatiellia bacterium]|mgnify:FL=1|nr:FHA domain-containing protein [Kiritimatiellia bacterium]HPR68687.1 FHA domain-containing protein [Kiritimatiellia bacterium]HRX06768.1 FHA domain-containing protein [Kiritimatiellia bacterium]